MNCRLGIGTKTTSRERIIFCCRMTPFIRRRHTSKIPRSIVVPRQEQETSDVVSTKTAKAVSIAIPHENDVLMGRGGKNNQHSGNEKLREFARRRSEDYRAATKKGKSDISRELVRLMRQLKPSAR